MSKASIQRRADLIPSLVRTVQGYAQQERQVLTEVTEARARARSIQVDPTNPEAVRQFAEAQERVESNRSAGSW